MSVNPIIEAKPPVWKTDSANNPINFFALEDAPPIIDRLKLERSIEEFEERKLIKKEA